MKAGADQAKKIYAAPVLTKMGLVRVRTRFTVVA